MSQHDTPQTTPAPLASMATYVKVDKYGECLSLVWPNGTIWVIAPTADALPAVSRD